MKFNSIKDIRRYMNHHFGSKALKCEEVKSLPMDAWAWCVSAQYDLDVLRGFFLGINESDLGTILFSKKYIYSEDIRYILWHEMGHEMTPQLNRLCLENELRSHMWALEEMLKKGYYKLYMLMIIALQEDADHEVKLYADSAKMVLDMVGEI